MRHPGSEEEDDPNDDYAINRERPETNCKSLGIKQFSSEDKSQDFDIWVSQFEDAVNRGLNPHSKRRHESYCLKWLSGYLSTDAYVIWKRAKNRNDWEKLKRELAAEYDDPMIRIEWQSNTVAYKWDENKESLTTYCSKIKRYVDTYDEDIAGVPRAVRNAYHNRFVAGLYEDYQKQIKMGMSSKKKDIDKALDIAVRFHAIKKEKALEKPEVGATVTFQDPSMTSRVSQNEKNIVRIMNDVGKIKTCLQSPANVNSGNSHQQRSFPQNNSSRGYPDSNQGKMQDRMTRFNDWRKGNSRGLGSRARGSLSRNRFNRQPQDGSRSGATPQPSKGTTESVSAASLDEGYALQSEWESDADELNDTIQQFAALTQEQQELAFMQFCDEKDREALVVPGNY